MVQIDIFTCNQITGDLHERHHSETGLCWQGLAVLLDCSIRLGAILAPEKQPRNKRPVESNNAGCHAAVTF